MQSTNGCVFLLFSWIYELSNFIYSNPPCFHKFSAQKIKSCHLGSVKGMEAQTETIQLM